MKNKKPKTNMSLVGMPCVDNKESRRTHNFSARNSNYKHNLIKPFQSNY